MTRARDVSRLVTTPPNIYATDSEASSGFLSLSSASSTYQTKATAGLTLINTTSFSAVSYVSIDSVFSATYKNYVVIYDINSASANNNHTLRLRVGGADNSTASSYKSATTYMLDNGTSGNNNTTGTTSWFVGTTKSTDAEWSRGELHFFKPFLTEKTNIAQIAIGVSGGGNLFSEYANHGHNAATSFDGFTIFFSSGTVTGSVSVYGYNK